jgi:probable F420-dependent oxidoreductase
VDCGEEFSGPEAVAEVCQAAEKAGFNAGLVTDHPAPTGRWLDAGGHHAQDPFVLLSFVAASTRTLRIQTGILVLPYRNPFVTARACATLDVLSRGRLSLGVGAGYLKGEYRAVGVDFDKRNDLMDEYIRALKAAWTQDEFTFEGTGYTALGNRITPRPVQRPHPPILVGGNSKRAIRRAAELGDAWNPYFTAGTLAATSRTAELNSEEGVEAGIAYLNAHCEAIGRKVPPAIELSSINGDPGVSNVELVARAKSFAALGVSALALHIQASTRAEWIETAERYGQEIVAKLG